MGRHFLLVVFTVAVVVSGYSYECEGKCGIKGIFNFGDSNSDTGGFYAAFPAERPPFGITFFKRPSGRASDGRLILDFLAQAIGIPFVSPYLKSIGSDYRHGANFATLASSVRLPNTSLFVTGVSPFSLAIQLNQMKDFKSRVLELYSHSMPTNEVVSTPLPSVDIFGSALYTFYIGQNDFTGNLAALGISGVMKFVPQVISQIADTIKELYGIGGRTFWVLNLAPIGCYPAFLVELPHFESDIDEFGCMISYNNAVRDYNDMLKETLNQTRFALPGASLVYVDTHSVLLDLFRHPTSYRSGFAVPFRVPSHVPLFLCLTRNQNNIDFGYISNSRGVGVKWRRGWDRRWYREWDRRSVLTSYGLKYGTKACCGEGGGPYNFNPNVYCGNTKLINGTTLTATSCDDPSKYVSWDGIHATEAANKIITSAILNGSLFHPPYPLHSLCDLHPIG